MSAVARKKPNHEVTIQLLAQCRDAPLVFDHVRPELCPALEAAVLFQMGRSRGSTPSLNVGGWKSPETVFLWSDPAVQALGDEIANLIGGNPVGWAMVNRGGSHHPRHQHRNARIVGVYYVTAGDPVTPTIFECSKAKELAVDPHPGRIVLSPGTMWHFLPRYDGVVPRISIAFEIKRS